MSSRFAILYHKRIKMKRDITTNYGFYAKGVFYFFLFICYNDGMINETKD